MKNGTIAVIISLILFVIGCVLASFYSDVTIPLYALFLCSSFVFIIFNALIWKKII